MVVVVVVVVRALPTGWLSVLLTLEAGTCPHPGHFPRPEESELPIPAVRDRVCCWSF